MNDYLKVDTSLISEQQKMINDFHVFTIVLGVILIMFLFVYYKGYSD